MTRAPDNLLAVRRLLLDHLGPNARPRPGVTILDPLGDPAWEVGIVGDADHRGGYHTGSDRVVRNDYSVIESPRDRAGLTLNASALDVGMFRVRTPKGVFDLRHYSRWLVQQCEAGTADTRHIREVIYSPDGKTVKRWDRLRKRTTGDKSHLSHTHESHFRDVTKTGADVTAVYRRYLTTIGLIKGDTMATTSEIAESVWSAGFGKGDQRRTAGQLLAESRSSATASEILLGQVRGQLAQLQAQVAQLAGQDHTDEQAIIAGVLAGLDPTVLAERIAAALPADQARQVADELAARLGQARE